MYWGYILRHDDAGLYYRVPAYCDPTQYGRASRDPDVRFNRDRLCQSPRPDELVRHKMHGRFATCGAAIGCRR